MKTINISIEWQDELHIVGTLDIFETRGQERYQFKYDSKWVNNSNSFQIDPALNLNSNIPYLSDQLWGVFKDISPDRWGRLGDCFKFCVNPNLVYSKDLYL